MPQRVLLTCDWFVKYTAGLAGGLAACEDVDVRLLTRDHDIEFGGVAGAADAFVATATGGRVAHHRLPGRVSELPALPRVISMRRSLREWRPDVVHFQDTVGSDPRLLLAAGLPRRRFALTVHDPSPHLGEPWTRQRRLGLRALLHMAGLVFVHSEALADELRDFKAFHAAVEVVPHGIDPPEVAPLPERPSVLFFGRISTYYKGLDVLLDAMPEVWRRVPEATLVIAGSGEIDPHPVLGDPRIVLRNEHVPDSALPGLFAQTTCCVLPYRQASQSGVGSQAKSYGRPIVASSVGGLPELVSPESGLLVPPGDPAALADALSQILADRVLAESMSRAAVAWVNEAGWERVGELTLAAYRRHLLDRVPAVSV